MRYLAVWEFFNDIYHNRQVMYEVAKRQIFAQHQRSVLGPVWTYIQPLAFVGVFWFVFAVGLRVNPGDKVPFLAYLISGLGAWWFFAESIGNLTHIISQHSYLVRKLKFPIQILPAAKLLSLLPAHGVLLGANVLLCMLYGLVPGWYAFQVFYYLIGMLLLLLGLGWLVSSTSLFFQDVSNIMRILVRFGFLLTPIFWNISKVPEQYRWMIRLNPMCYIVTGYRDSFLYRAAFWTKPYETAYFWMITTLFLLSGALVFNKLRPHFAEMV
jgi:lipopolysaccharide transport system permease protein/teichoic acid transport system permease protein